MRAHEVTFKGRWPTFLLSVSLISGQGLLVFTVLLFPYLEDKPPPPTKNFSGSSCLYHEQKVDFMTQTDGERIRITPDGCLK